MEPQTHVRQSGSRQRRTPTLSIWQWLITLAVLLGAIIICAALIYFQPGTRTFTSPAGALPAQMAERSAPPGTETYYYWGQHRPLDQQP